MNKYFNFLCDKVGGSYEYNRLLAKLHEVEFYSLVPNDDNRGADGEQIRSMFLEEVGPTWAPSLPNGPCTVLEMLIGVALRLEFELAGGRYERNYYEWFWVLIDNLGLKSYTDVHFDDKDVCNIINILLERGYDTDGNGGLFPLHDPEKDQRRVEIWYQMSAWIIENYPI